jgi:hypothetical protein
VFGRELAAGDAEIADDAGLAIEQAVVAVERPVRDSVAHTELTRMTPGIRRVVRVVEEAKVHRLEELDREAPQRRLGVGDHGQPGGQPGIVHRGKVMPDRAGVEGGNPEPGTGSGVQIIHQEPVGSVHAGERREGPLQA